MQLSIHCETHFHSITVAHRFAYSLPELNLFFSLLIFGSDEIMAEMNWTLRMSRSLNANRFNKYCQNAENV